MASNKSHKKLRATDVLALDAVLELSQNPKKLFWLNFRAGFVRGFSGVIGAVLAILILGYLVSNLGGAPIIGDFIKDIGEATQTTR